MSYLSDGAAYMEELSGLSLYRRYEEIIGKKGGPVAVFGLQDGAKAHLVACTGEKRPVLYVCATDTGAMEMWEMVKGFSPEAALFLPRDVPLVHVLNVSDERSIQRVGALTRAVTRDRPVLICSAEAVMQKLAPKEAFLEQCSLIRSGDTMEPGQLVGCWQVTGTQEYWRYRSDYSGVTWDESEDISEEESNLTYTWTINGDELTHVFSGEMGNQAVPKVYTVTSISANAMEWKDIYGMTKTFNKVN